MIGARGVGGRGGEVARREGSSERVRRNGLEEVGGGVGDDHAGNGLKEVGKARLSQLEFSTRKDERRIERLT